MYNFERISKDRLSHLVVLYKAAFNKTISVAVLEKKFDTKRLGTGYLGFLAYDENNEPAAYYGVFPYAVYDGKDLIVTAQSGDTMTHPLHQGKGLFTKLATMTYDLAKSEGIALVWGFPNKNSYPGFIKKLNWVDNEILVKCKIKVATLPCAKLVDRLKFNWLNSSYSAICNSIFRSDLTKFIKLKNNDIPFIQKDDAFFKYKSYIEGRFIIGNAENNAWIKIESSVLIGDLVCTGITEFNTLIDKLKSKCAILGITEMIFICTRNNPELAYFKQRKDAVIEESLSYCHLAGWNDELAKSMSICLADFDTF